MWVSGNIRAPHLKTTCGAPTCCPTLNRTLSVARRYSLLLQASWASMHSLVIIR